MSRSNLSQQREERVFPARQSIKGRKKNRILPEPVFRPQEKRDVHIAESPASGGKKDSAGYHARQRKDRKKAKAMKDSGSLPVRLHSFLPVERKGEALFSPERKSAPG